MPQVPTAVAGGRHGGLRGALHGFTAHAVAVPAARRPLRCDCETAQGVRPLFFGITFDYLLGRDEHCDLAPHVVELAGGEVAAEQRNVGGEQGGDKWCGG